MAVNINYYPVGSVPTLIANMGPGEFFLTATATGGTVSLGNSTAVTTTTGQPYVSGVGPYMTRGYVTSRQSSLYAVTAGTAVIGVTLSTPQ